MSNRRPIPLRMVSVLCGGIALTGTGFYISAQQAPYNRLLHVIVTEPSNRIVTGLARESFEVIENGVVRPVTLFDTDSRVSIALVGVSPAAVARLTSPKDDLIQAQSVADAVQQLAASKNIRKALIVVGAAGTPAVPDGIEVLNSDETNLPRAVLEVYSEYVLGFSSSGPTATVEVTLKPPQGLPSLKLAQR